MGWCFSSSWATREQLLAYLRSPERFGDFQELLRTTAIGNNHWYLAKQRATGIVWVGLDLMKFARGEGGYKDLCDTMGPCEVNCPLSYINAASPPTGYAIEWREKVRQYHARRAAAAAPEKGLVVAIGPEIYTLIAPYAPRMGWTASRQSDGAVLRIPAAMLNRALMRAAGE